MAATPIQQLGVIGTGLIGGSFAIAMRRAGLVERIVGYNKQVQTTERARKLGVIDETAERVADLTSGSDLVLLSVPVSATESTLTQMRDALNPSTVVMDVGSTKRDVVDAARRVLKDKVQQFVPAHPITGKELSGIHNADATLFKARQVILTPINQTHASHVDKAVAWWSALGAHVAQMTPEGHDMAFAAVSHLPHLLAFAYFSAVAKQPSGPSMLSLAGPGFRDFTRIAASDPEMWRDVLLSNREEILKQSQRFRHTLDAIELVMKSGNGAALEDLIRQSSTLRAHWQMHVPKPTASAPAAASASAQPSTPSPSPSPSPPSPPSDHA